jgi:hypothetical protein
MGANRLATAVAAAISGMLLSTVAAFADAPANAPLVSPPGSMQNEGGPTVWNPNQEVTALSGARTPDPEYLAKGIPMGAFRLFPNLVTSVSYDDNVFRLNTGGKSDFFFTESPTLVLDYETNEAHVDLYGDGTFNQYTRLTTVDNNAYDFGARGTYLITRAAEFSGNISYSQLVEPLSSPDTIGAQSGPNVYNLFDASGQVAFKPNRFGITVGGSYDSYSYQNTDLFGSGQLNNSDRDNGISKGFAQASYDFSPGYSGYVRATYNSDDYSHFYDRSGYHRSSHGYQADGGVQLLLGELVTGTVYVGYVDQAYDHNPPLASINPSGPPLQDIGGIDFGASLTWYPTELLTVELAAARQIENTTLDGASGGDDRSVGLTANYELTRRVILTGQFGYDDTDFKGSTPFQDDRTTSFGFGAKYLISHYVQTQVNYLYASRDSTLSQLAYTDNLITLGLNLQI